MEYLGTGASGCTPLKTNAVGIKFYSNLSKMESPDYDMPLSRRTLEQTYDPFNTSIVDDLLSSLTDWRGVNDIVRLTLRALTDSVKAQSATLRDLERLTPSRADWSEVLEELSQKANVSEVSRSLAEVSDELQSKVRLSDIQRLLDEKVPRSDLQFALGTKVSVEDFRKQIDLKAATADVEADLRGLEQSVSRLKTEEISQLYKLVDTKAGIQEVCEALDEKANKQNVSEALKNKVTRLELENLLSSKTEAVSLTQTDLDRVFSQLDRKATLKDVERLETALAKKLEKREATDLIMQEIAPLAAKAEVEGLQASISSARRQTELRLDDQFLELDSLLSTIKSEFEGMYSALSNSVSRKADLKEVEEVSAKLGGLVEYGYFETALGQIKAEMQARVDRALESSKLEVRVSALEQVKQQVHELSAAKKLHEQQLEDFKKHIVEYCSSSSADLLQDFKAVKRDLSTLCETQREILGESEDRFTALKLLVDSVASEVKGELAALQKDFHNEFAQVKDHAAVQEKAVKAKPDSKFLEAALERKADIHTLHQLAASIEDLKAKQTDFSADLSAKQSLFEDKLLQLAASLSEVSSTQLTLPVLTRSLENKVEARDFRRTAVEFKDQLKQLTDEFQGNLTDQTMINEALCSENVLARWAWKSRTLAGTVVPWEEQSVNTCPENFLWSKDTTNIIAVSPGLYEVTFGFFARHKPTITLLVNGEPVLQRVVKTSKTSRPQAPVSGVTQVEFLALPSRASVSVNYSGEPGEGFVGLKKL
jgi:hypothetical protein